jgi:uncharacterized protein
VSTLAAERRHVAAGPQSLEHRVAAIDWKAVAAELDAHGCATTGVLLSAAECSALIEAYGVDKLFRSRIVMARHGFGRGEYKYFAYPLPDIVATLRDCLFPQLAHIANAWNAAQGRATHYPHEHREYLACCHKAGQHKPTPLLLSYGPGDYNCLHQDLYGELVFPLQVAFLLSRPAEDFRRWGIRADRAAPAHAVARRSRSAPEWRGRDFSRASSARAGQPRHLSGHYAARGKPSALGPAAYARHYLS